MFSHDLPGDRAAMKWDLFEKSVGTLSCGATSFGKIYSDIFTKVNRWAVALRREESLVCCNPVVKQGISNALPLSFTQVYKWVLDNAKVINSSLVLQSHGFVC